MRSKCKCFVHIVRHQMKLAFAIAEQAVVAGPCPITITVDQNVIERQELQRTIDIKNRIERRFQLI